MLGFSFDLGWFGIALAAIYLVWMVNLYNFMDGIDGIAGIEAITVVLGGVACWWLAARTPNWIVGPVFAASVAGFLIWNYPPARIFMGDAGSGFIGMVLGFLSLWTAQEQPHVFWCWFILIGCFMVDATTTLIRRKHGSHKAVSLAVGAINLLWLLPLALAVATNRLDGLAGTLIAYPPLVWLAYRYKAGDRAAQAA
jgi:Fuc2NAc and GlcNAc transferase